MIASLDPIEMVVLQGTPYCNLNCSYCDLSVQSRKQRIEMSLDMITQVFQEVFASGLCGPKLSVVWHSGEPLTLSPAYYAAAIKRITALRDRLSPDPVALTFDFQTNGVLINAAWIRFFSENRNRVRLGVSCDGPVGMHDAFRNNWGGKPTHAKVVAGMQQLAEAKLPFKIISVITDQTLADPDGFFDFIESWSDHLSGFHFNILADGALAGQAGLTYSRSDRARYYAFYRHLLDRSEQAARQGSALRVQNFSQAMARVLEDDQDHVADASHPLRTLNVDARGFVTSFYAGLDKSAFADRYGDGDGLSLGNITETSLLEMIGSKKFMQILSDFQRSQADCRAGCAYYRLCSGGFELSKLSEHGTFDGGETAECAIIVKTLADALLDRIAENTAPDKMAG